MLNLENPRCPQCGQPLDIEIDPQSGRQKVNGCTNPDCPSNQVNR